MQGHNVVAVYASLSDAQRVRDRLIAEGIPNNDIRISSATERAETLTDTPSDTGEERPGFFRWLFGEIPENERDYYTRHFQENREAVSVWVTNETEREKAIGIMTAFAPIDLGEEEGSARPAAIAEAAEAPLPQSAKPDNGVGRGAVRVGERHPRSGMGATGKEEVVPVIKEELEVGKRQVERRGRIRIYTTERPVEETILLRDERTEIERRPASREATPAELAAGADREIETIERHEEPVVEKRGQVTEEVVVRHEAGEHEQTVRGTVQETHVEEEGKTGPASTQYERQAGTDKTTETTDKNKLSESERRPAAPPPQPKPNLP